MCSLTYAVGSVAVDSVVEVERGWEAAVCRVLRHRLAGHHRLAVGRDQVAGRGQAEAVRGREAGSARVARGPVALADLALEALAPVAAELVGPRHLD